MSVAETLEFDPERVRPQGQADTRPAPGLFTFDWDATKASAEQAYWDTPGRSQDTRNVEIGRAARELARSLGRDPTYYEEAAPGVPAGGYSTLYEAGFWRDLAEARRTRPDLLDDFAKDKASFDGALTQRFQQAASSRAQRMGQQGLLGNLAGGVVGSFSDPYNVITLPIGGWGRSAATRILTEAAAQSAIQVAQTPALAFERSQQGVEFTAGDAAWNIGLAGAGGAAFKGVEIGIGAGVRAIGNAVPDDVKAAMALRRAKPDYALTPDEAAALHVVTRGTEVDAANPFSHTYEGLEQHAGRIDKTIAAMSLWPQPSAPLAPVRPRTPARAPGGVTPDFNTAWRAVIGIEGGTNRDGSFRTSPAGAIGPAQVMPGTAPEAARLAGLPFDERRYRTDAAYNEALGQAYYREMLRQFDGDPAVAAAAYNAGPGSAKRGTGVRGAMARARRAGVPDDWVSFLPAETRAYIANFRRRTGMEAGRAIDAGEMAGFDGAPARPAALDAERPAVDGLDFEIEQVRNSPVLPELRRDLFANDSDWRAAQAVLDREAFGVDPAKPAAIDVAQGVDVRQHNADFEMLPEWERHLEAVDSAAASVRADGGTPLFHGTSGAWRDANDSGLGMTFFAEDAAAASRYTGASGGRRGAGRQGGEGRVLVQPLPGDARILDITSAEGAAVLASLPREGRMASIIIDAARRGVDEGDVGRASTQMWQMTKNAAGSDARGIREAIVDQLAARGYAGMRFLDDSHPTVALFDDAPAIRDVDAPAVRDEIEAEGGSGPAVIDVDAGKVFDNPTGDPVAGAAELAWHDAQAAAAARQAPEQLTFDLGDGRGERTIADIEAEMKADEDAISTIESCLVPGAAA